MRKILIILCCGILLLVCGCNKNSEVTPTTDIVKTASEITKTEKKESPIESRSTENASAVTTTTTEKEKEVEAEPTSSAESKVPTITPSKAETVVTEKQSPKENTTSAVVTTEKEVQEIKTEEIPKVTEPTVDIDYFITYAKDYANNIGLQYDSTATACWDNPIAADKNTQRVIEEIEYRLNRYKNIEEFEYICIWYEKTPKNEFEIYIGYA